MKCLRCGHCCSWGVFIPVLDGDEWKGAYKPDGERCPHFRCVEGQAACAIHDLPIFKGSPCDRYGNPDFDPDFIGKAECFVGRGRAGKAPAELPPATLEVVGELRLIDDW